jgi:HD superfamily phosphohydrolase
MGHGPFSHALELSLVSNVKHEDISLLFMERLNNDFNGRLSRAIEIFTGKYPKKFLCQLVSGQLDMDRMDYLKRDSFYTGVCEGVISSDRIINMLQTINDTLVVEVKGIYSIENFLISRRLMYWQVYLHKTAIVAEKMLVNIIKRARQLIMSGKDLSICKQLDFFLRNKITYSDFQQNSEILNYFSILDDHDIMSALKSWTLNEDKVLSSLSKSLLKRNLLSIELHKEPIELSKINSLKKSVMKQFYYTEEEAEFFVFTGTISNNAYNIEDDKINILLHGNLIKDISEASDMFNLSVLGKTVQKNYICYPKELID